VDSANSEAEREAERAEPQASALSSTRVQRTAAGALAGGLLGGIAGAAIGSIFGPVGAVLGGLVGAIGGALLGDLGSRSRKLKAAEIAQAKEVFKDSIDYSKIEITRDSVFSAGAPRTIGNTIHLKSDGVWQHFKGDTLDLSDETSTKVRPTGEQTLIHEMTHVWQYQNGGIAYLPQSLIAQIKAQIKTGSRSAAYNWREAVAKKLPWAEWNPEQQAELVEDYNISLRAINNHTGTPKDYQTVSDASPYIEKIQSREGAPTFLGSGKKVQKKSRGAVAEVSSTVLAPPVVHDVLRSAGRPLDAGTRSFMETRFGRDFSDVRLHTGGQAAQSARAVDALAYTVGSDIVMDASHFNPATGRGAHLLAHELAHVAQNAHSTDSRPGKLMVGSASDPAEREAERAADRAIGGGAPPVGVRREANGYLRRQTADEPKKEPKPWIQFGDWSFNPSITAPKLGTGSLEDVHKGWVALQGSGNKLDKCPPGWRFLRTSENEGRCCQGYPTDEKHCCSPKEITMDRGVWACKTAADKPKPDSPASPAPAPGEINKDFKVNLPPVPDLTIDRPVHFNLDQPTSVVGSEPALRASLTAEGKSDLTQLIGWLVKFPDFGVQLTGMASVEGPPAHNMQLGETRARSVANVLIARGIAPYRITEPVGAKDDCPALSSGIHNCGDSLASKTANPNDRQVRARLFLLPELSAKKP
jgi:Domain of unknown function (DUF4157)/OmpA family